jgi:transposase
MADQTPQALAPTESPSYKRLTDADRITILHLHDDGLTLTAIAQRLGRSVSTIHDVVQTYAPTTDLAKRKLAAASERMAENIIANGQPRDHVATLKGLGVLEPDKTEVKFAFGVSLPGLPTPSEGQQKA